jgi:hypothetical protein
MNGGLPASGSPASLVLPRRYRARLLKTTALAARLAAKTVQQVPVTRGASNQRPIAVLFAMLAATAAIIPDGAGAQTLTWGATGGGGTGPWDTSTANWFMDFRAKAGISLGEFTKIL